MRVARVLLLTVALVCGLTGALYAQAGTDISKGSISVDVWDPSAAVIQGAKVTITGPAGQQMATTDLRGQAVFLNLIPGTYTVRVEQPGFRTFEQSNIDVRPALRAPVRAQLEPGAVTETVQVTAAPPAVDTSTTTTGTTLPMDTFTNLPIARNIVSLFQLVPGVAPSGGALVGASNPSIGGSSGLENQYIIDGINTTDQGFGSFGVYSVQYGPLGTGVNFDFVRDVQVKTGGFEAQYGQALGGIVNVVTASGGNGIHGALYGYSTPGGAEAHYLQPNQGFGPYAPRIGAPAHEVVGRNGWDVGLNVGGPFIKNRFFWYGGFNPSFYTTLEQSPQGFGARVYGGFPTKTKAYSWVGKLNFNINDNHHLEGTAFGDPTRVPTGLHRLFTVDDPTPFLSKLEYGSRNWAVKYNGLFGARTALNSTFAWNNSNFNEIPSQNGFEIRDYTLPTANSLYTIRGGLGFLQNNNGDNRQWTTMVSHNMDLLGGHQIDLGYMFNDAPYSSIEFYSGPNWPLPPGGGIDPGDVGKTVYGGIFYYYPTRKIAGHTYQNVYREVRGRFSSPNISTDTRYHAIYGQDAWQINRYLTAKLGLRWEEQQLHGNTSGYTFAGNWAPRLGFIIDPTGARKTKIFANWGRFYEKIPLDIAVREMSIESTYLNIYSFAIPPTAANLVPGGVASPSGTLPTIVAGGTKSQYETEIVAGAEHELSRFGLVLNATFQWRNLNRIIEDVSGITVEQSLAGAPQQYVISNPSLKLDIFTNPVACTSGPNCDPTTGYTFNSSQLIPDGIPDGFPDPRRVYKALNLSAEKRFTGHWSVYVSYRLAKLFGNYEGLFRNDNDQADPNITSLFDFVNSPALADQFRVGVLPTDRRHVGTIYGNYLFHNFNIGIGYQTLSGTPLTGFLAHPAYANAGELPLGARGAYGRAPWQNYVDLRLDYQHPITERLRLKVGSNLFNLFNRQTVTRIDQNIQLDGGVPNPDFLKPLTVHRPFYAAFNARLEF